MAGLNFPQWRHNFRADVHFMGAAGVKGAAGRRIGWGWQIALQNYALALFRGVGNGNCGEQSFGVRVQGIVINLPCGTLFHDFSKIHHGDIVANMLYHRQIVGDE